MDFFRDVIQYKSRAEPLKIKPEMTMNKTETKTQKSQIGNWEESECGRAKMSYSVIAANMTNGITEQYAFVILDSIMTVLTLKPGRFCFFHWT